MVAFKNDRAPHPHPAKVSKPGRPGQCSTTPWCLEPSQEKEDGQTTVNEVRPVPEIIRTWFSDHTILSSFHEQDSEQGEGLWQVPMWSCSAQLEGWAPWKDSQCRGQGCRGEAVAFCLRLFKACLWDLDIFSPSPVCVCVLTLTSLVPGSVSKSLYISSTDTIHTRHNGFHIYYNSSGQRKEPLQSPAKRMSLKVSTGMIQTRQAI